MSNKIGANPNIVTIDQFSDELGKNHGVIDVNNLSDQLSSELAKAGITKEELQKIAGPDGQIKTFEYKALVDKKSVTNKLDGEYRQLFKAVDRFETTKTPTQFELKNMAASDQPLTPSGSLYEALKNEVERNRKLTQYQKPGGLPDRPEDYTETPKPTIKDAVQVKEKQNQLKPVDLKMDGVSQTKLKGLTPEQQQQACNKAAREQTENFNLKTYANKAPKLNGVDQAIQIAYGEDPFGVVEDPKQLQIGKDYINKCLDKGLPVMVGVSTAYRDAGNYDDMTEHFVTIDSRGYDKEGRLFYGFKDPGNGGKPGIFFVNKNTGNLFKPAGEKDRGLTVDKTYELTQVRTYDNVR